MLAWIKVHHANLLRGFHYGMIGVMAYELSLDQIPWMRVLLVIGLVAASYDLGEINLASRIKGSLKQIDE